MKRHGNTLKSVRFENYSGDDNFLHGLGDTHYFVMTAKKESLLRKGVLYRDLGIYDIYTLQWEPKKYWNIKTKSNQYLFVFDVVTKLIGLLVA